MASNNISQVTENAVFAGLVRLNTVENNEGKPTGWYVREKIDPETGKGYALELGAYLNSEIFVSVPVHYSMKHMFTSMNIVEPGYKYYAVPRNVDFAIEKRIGKKSNQEYAMLVKPTEENPAVFLCCLAHASKTSILGCVVSNQNNDMKILKKYIDKDRGFIGFIAMSSTPDFTCTLSEGIPGMRRKEISINKFTISGVTTESDVENTTEPVKSEFINLPLLIELPKKEKPDTDKKNINDKKFHKNNDHAKTYGVHDANTNNNTKQVYNTNNTNSSKKFNDPDLPPYNSRKNDRYNRKKNHKNNKRNRHYDD